MRNRWLLLLVLLLAACNSSGQTATPTPTTAPPAEAAPTTPPTAVPSPTATTVVEATETPAAPTDTPLPPTPTSEAAVIIEDVIIPAADELALVGTFYVGPGEAPHPGVLLLHMLGSNRGVWADLAVQLVEAGYAVLALDMRGHGETGGSPDWTQAPDDVARAWQYLAERSEVDAENTAVVGASIGSNLALVAGATEPRVKTVVLLSPGLDYRGVTTADRIVEFGDRPALMVASREDTYSANTVETLIDLALSEESRLQMYDGAGHGTDMFGPQPGLADLILEWLSRHLAFLR